jgi:hypothetical protein
MSNVSDKTLQSLVNTLEIEGMELTLKSFNIPKDTMARYLRKAKARDIQPTTTWGSAPRVFVFDIETLPLEVFSWGLNKQFIGHDNIIKEWCVLSWAGKWLMGDEIFGDVLTPEECINRDDKRIVESVWNIIDQADILIGHNGRRFDIRKLNARFIWHDLQPPSPFEMIDTYKDAVAQFAFTSFKQDYLTKFFDLQHKLETNFQLWVDCANGVQSEIDKMYEYNRHDVMGLEELYLKLCPWMTRHPSMNLYYSDMQEERCPRCGSIDTEKMGKLYHTTAGAYQTFRCVECKGLSRLGKNQIKHSSKKKRITSR